MSRKVAEWRSWSVLQEGASVLKEKHMRGQDQHKVTSATSFPLRYAHIDHVIKSCIRNTMDCQSHTASRSANYPNTTSTAHSKFQCGSSSSKMCFTILRPVMPRTTATAAGLGGTQTSLSSRLTKFVWPRGSWIRRRTPKKNLKLLTTPSTLAFQFDSTSDNRHFLQGAWAGASEQAAW